MRKYTFILIIFLLTALKASSQQLPVYSQYMFNKFLINPAAAGSDGYTTLNLVAREQWVGFPGTPKTHSLIIDSRILRNSYIEKEISVRKKKRLSSRSGRVGWGGHVFNDNMGPLSRTGVEASYAYHLNFNDAQLSLGLTGVFYQFRLDKKNVTMSDDLYDPLIDGMKGTIYIPDANIGIYFASTRLHGGVSVMQLLQSAVQFGDNNGSEYKMKRHYNIMAGFLHSFNDNFSVEPSVLVKIPAGLKPQIDINGRIFFRETYWFGII